MFKNFITKVKNRSKKREKTKEEIIFDTIQSFYLEEDNYKINKLAKKISITNIIEKDIEYVKLEGYYETRKIFNIRKASSYVKPESDRVVSADSYNKWNFKLQSYVKEFVNEKNTYVMNNTKYIENCKKCVTKGRYECKDCLTGYFNCKFCGSSGKIKCSFCGGRGGNTCNICGGHGYNIEWRYEWRGNEEVRVCVNETCYRCSGTGLEDCIYCGGSGAVYCDECNGQGCIPCNTCHGTKIVICGDCEGKGYFLHQVELEQNYASTYVYSTIKGYDVDPEKYGEKKFDNLILSEKDICTYEYVSDDIIESTPNAKTAHMSVSLNEKINANGAKSVIKYRAKEFRREVVEVEYTVKGRNFNSMIDLSTGQIITDKNPYDVFKIKIKPKKVKNNAKKDKSKDKKKKRIVIDLDKIVTCLIGIAIFYFLYFYEIIKFIKYKEWIHIIIHLVTFLLFPALKLIRMYDDLYGFRLLQYIKMAVVVFFISIITYFCAELLYVWLLDLNIL